MYLKIFKNVMKPKYSIDIDIYSNASLEYYLVKLEPILLWEGESNLVPKESDNILIKELGFDVMIENVIYTTEGTALCYVKGYDICETEDSERELEVVRNQIKAHNNSLTFIDRLLWRFRKKDKFK